MQQISDFEPTLGDYVAILRKRWRIVAFFAGVSTAVAVVAALLMPKQWVAVATILPQDGSGSRGGVLSMMAAKFGGDMGLPGLPMGGSAGSEDLTAILQSRAMAKRVVAALSLETRLPHKFWKSDNGLLRYLSRAVTIVPPTLKSGIISIECKGSDPRLAADIANSYEHELKAMLDQMGYQASTRSRRFLGKELDRTRAQLARTEDQLAAFQSKHSGSLPAAIQSSIGTLGQLEAQRMRVTASLSGARAQEKLASSQVSALQTSPDALVRAQTTVRGLRAQENSLLAAQSDLNRRLASLPPLVIKLARLQQDVAIEAALYQTLASQYDVALVDESREDQAFLPLDNADIPDKPINGKKRVIVLAALIAGLLGGALAAFAAEGAGRGSSRERE